jgi:thioredoxin reductase
MDQDLGGGEAPFDAAVVGGSFAGLSAALYLARGRRRVAVFDDGATRNRYAAHAHGFLGQDGAAPDAIRMRGRAEVLAYPTVRLREARVTGIEGGEGAFRVRAVDGSVTAAARVVLAHGMRDLLPAIPGLQACWGVTAVQCPYCHGYELADRPTGILMTAPGLPHHVRLLRDWTADLTLLANGHALSDAEREEAHALGVRAAEGAVAALRHRAGQLEAARLANGGEVALGALYLVTRSEPAAPLADDLGLAMDEGPTGRFVKVDEMRRTSLPGVFAAGDLARPFYGSAFAAADGVTAGTACHRSLLGF